MVEIKRLERDELTALIQKCTPFFKEAKKRIIATVFIFIAAAMGGFIFYEKIISALVATLSLKGINIVFTSPFQFINLAFTCGLVVGLVFVIPLVLLQLFQFLKPALNQKEYRLITRFIPFSFILFLAGFIFGMIIMKWQIEIFLAQSISLGIGNILDISGLLTTVFLTSALLGLGFQFPVILLLLIRLHVLNRQQLARQRQWVYLGSLIFALLLPPDSILADFLLTLPLIILFEFTLILARFTTKSTPALSVSA